MRQRTINGRPISVPTRTCRTRRQVSSRGAVERRPPGGAQDGRPGRDATVSAPPPISNVKHKVTLLCVYDRVNASRAFGPRERALRVCLLAQRQFGSGAGAGGGGHGHQLDRFGRFRASDSERTDLEPVLEKGLTNLYKSPKALYGLWCPTQIPYPLSPAGSRVLNRPHL